MSRFAAKIDQVFAVLNRGDHDGALAQARLLYRAAPGDCEILNLLRSVHEHRGEAEQCVFFAKAATEAAPDRGDLACEYGRVLETQGAFDESLKHLERGFKLLPDHETAYAYFAGGLMSAGAFGEAERLLTEGLAKHPNSKVLLRRRTGVMLETGRAEEAMRTWDRVLAMFPDDKLMLSEWAAGGYGFPLSPPGQLARSRRYAEVVAAEFAASGGTPLRARGMPGVAPFAGGRPLRVGIMSSDLRGHSVGFFALPMLRALAAMRAELTVFIYDTMVTRDGISTRLREAVAEAGWHWREAIRMTDEMVARKIAADEPDVLVDLNGLSTGARPGVLLWRPAPVQVTFLGFPFTTGSAAVDYRLSDDLTDPEPGTTIAEALTPGFTADPQAWYSERLVRLRDAVGRPHPFLLYEPPEQMPRIEELSPPPVLSAPDGIVTFGSFNMLPKLVDGCVSLMARVLEAVPGSRLLLKASTLGDEPTAKFTLSRFASRGVDPSRVVIVPWQKSYAEHFAQYAKVDIALDTFPYTGTTTTIEALCMGVPVVTLCPDNAPHQCRVSGSILHFIGREDWVARVPDEYVATAARLARDFGTLQRARHELRGDVLGSALCNKASFAETLSRTLRELCVW